MRKPYPPRFARLNYFLSVLIMMCISNISLATTYYSRVNNGNWTAVPSWSIISHTGAAATNYPQGSDTIFIANNHKITLDSSPLECGVIIIGQGASGQLLYRSGTNTIFNITGNLIINNGGSVQIENGGPAIHTLNISGNFTNNGSVVFKNSSGGNKEVNIRFIGTSNTIVSGTGTWTLVKTDITKTNKSAEVNIQSAGFVSAVSTASTGFLGMLLTRGTFILNCNATLTHFNNTRYNAEIDATQLVNDLTINENVRVEILQGTLNLATTGDNTINLYGDLEVAGGTLIAGGGTGSVGGIRYYTVLTDTASIIVSSGNLNVVGTIIGKTTMAPLAFTQSGGVINVSMGTAVPAVYNFQVNSVINSKSVISGGTINILRNTTASASFSLNGLFPANVIVTGGTVVFGNSATAYNYLFEPFSLAVYPHIRVSGVGGTTLRALSALDFKFLSLSISANNTFDFINSPLNTLTLLSTYDGVIAFYNAGIFTHRTGTVIFHGSINQSIAGTIITTFYNLKTDNAAGVTLQQSENVSNVLTLVNGELSLNSNTLTIQNSSVNAIARPNTGYIKSETNTAFNPSILKWEIGTNTGNYIFPFGVSSSEYIPVTFDKLTDAASSVSISTRATGTDNLPLATGTNMNSVWGGSAATVIDRWWDITPSVNPLPSPGANIIFSYRGVENTLSPVGYQTEEIQVQHWTDGSGWDFPVGGATGVTSGIGTVTAPGATNYSPFILVAAAGPLPVSLIDFNAELKSDEVVVEWKTASEISNDYFTVEKSLDGKTFNKVIDIKGAGNSNNVLSYSIIDKEPYHGTSYYRLKQTDFDGKFAYFDLKPLKNNVSTSTVNIYPNPVKAGTGALFIKGLSKENSELKITDICGRECFSGLISANEEFQVPAEKLQSLTTGVYFVHIINENDVSKRKIMIE